jgi:hypothetical protein
MSTVILKGQEALHYAEAHHLPLHYDGDSRHPANDHMSHDEAVEVLGEHPDRVWVESHVPINTGELSDEYH